MPGDVLSSWKAALNRSLQALEQRHQRRTLAEVRGIDFCSNDYLGLAEHPAMRAAVAAAVERAPRIGGTASRLLSGHTHGWSDLEQEFAEFAGTEAALFFGSGYAANVGLLSAIVDSDDVVYSDVLNHASLIDGMRLSGARKVIYPHLDLSALEDSLRQDAGAPWRRIIVTESVFSMNGDRAPLREMATLAEQFGAAMIVDEAHATGVHGRSGSGLAAEAGILPQVLATIHTCGKALASAGAFVCGPAVMKDYLINHARTFIFSTALPPYFAEQIRAAVKLAAGMDMERQVLLKRSKNLNKAFRRVGFNTGGSSSQIVPVILGSNQDTLEAAEHLQGAGFAVRAIRPPTVPEGKARLRLSLTARIEEEQLDRLVKSLVEWRDSRTPRIAARHA
jgi:8-amino-7-oxononanoate synthase